MAGHTLSSSQRNFLEGLFPGEDALFSPEEMLVFGTDASRACAAPLAAVRPTSEEQVVELLAWAHRERVPLYPRARATNLVGGCVPGKPGVAVSTLKMNRIKEVSRRDFCAVVEPGVVTAELQTAVEAQGLFYPPDPASVRISTIGGNVSTNAGGMRALKYGVTRDFVLGVRAVLPGGEIIATGGRNHKDVVGLDLTGLMVGSEGTLAFMTQITLKLLPLPEAQASVMAGFENETTAIEAAGGIFAAGILPSALELICREPLEAVEKMGDAPWPPGTGAVLLMRLDGSVEGMDAEVARLAKVLEKKSPGFIEKALERDAEEKLWESRRLINPASFRIAPDKLSDDITVPRGRVAETVAGIREMAGEAGLDVLNFGHLGDGNIHVNIMHDKSAGQGPAAEMLMDRIIELVIGLGGTMSGEHGVGLAKLKYFDRQVGSRERELMRSIKSVFDARGIMNPGKGY
jgi:D-lactate dehydrogenase (cytochrome)/glycolate oxidase